MLPVSTVLRQYLHSLDLTQAELADRLRVNPKTVSDLVNSRQRLTPRMAKKLERVTGKPALEWLNIQSAHDLTRKG